MQLETLLQQAEHAIKSTTSIQDLEQCRVEYLGKKGSLTEIIKTIGQLPPDERKLAGQNINLAKENIEQWIKEKSILLKNNQLKQQLEKETIDITLPGRDTGCGSIHPVTQSIEDLQRIFEQMGFISLEGPEIEDDEHNFTRLNTPPFHPARAMQDTFYFPNGLLLRTQTSAVQIRAMKYMQPPLRMISIGRVYRRDFDLTHTPMFHQIEVLVIDEDATLATLKHLLTQVLQAFFAREVTIQFRPSYFPFTEPSLEVDIGCIACNGRGTVCRVCKQTGFVEVLGCGMVHPHVLKMADVDTKRYRGFAVGAGIDRLTMLKYGILDLRSLFENDVRFLKQF
ncbi:MAG: phenylalanine--tRNA ligase subunit alpha [Gammaproteobacteria bacterium RIFCSPHIGHO2_12_FULL_42_10]|nr:MAG: phenylalanine--tRNA ligase subunit alpha [Gammaproteobacteria bacterium RIFCSPHIGHO2_12_FULL_42_10]